MRSVGIKVLKNKLSEYVRLAASGETVLVTDRDRVVPRPGINEKDKEARWAEAVRLGHITPAKNPRATLPEGLSIMSLDELMADLAKDREDR